MMYGRRAFSRVFFGCHHCLHLCDTVLRYHPTCDNTLPGFFPHAYPPPPPPCSQPTHHSYGYSIAMVTPISIATRMHQLYLTSASEGHPQASVVTRQQHHRLRRREPNGSCLFAAGHLPTLSAAKAFKLSLIVKHHILGIDEAS